MTSLPWFSAEDIRTHLTPARTLEVMEDAFRALALGQALQPLRTVIALPDGRSSFLVMPAHLADPAALGVKLLTLFPGNRHIPSHQGLLLLFDAATGEPRALMDAGPITALRTAAASALATRELALPGADVLALLGSGVQAWSHLEAIKEVRSLRDIRVWSPTPAHRERFAAEASSRFSLPVRAVASAEAAVRSASIICTLTASPTPILSGAWLTPGAHVNLVGASTAQTREMDSAGMLHGRIYVDARESALAEAGDVLIPISEGVFEASHIVGELGELLQGTIPGRADPTAITIFKSVGLAVQDLAAGEALVALSRTPPSL